MFRDAEIEQPHAAVIFHQDVRRFQIAVDNRALVRVLNRLADLPE
jgi:hypothetical protein